jgi:predicted RNase H-like HicB family nuclease
MDRKKEEDVRYHVYITQKGSLYSAEVPALPGCGAVGRSEHEAIKNIRFIIQEHRVRLQRTRQPLPLVMEVELPEEGSKKTVSSLHLNGNRS